MREKLILVPVIALLAAGCAREQAPVATGQPLATAPPSGVYPPALANEPSATTGTVARPSQVPTGGSPEINRLSEQQVMTRLRAEGWTPTSDLVREGGIYHVRAQKAGQTAVLDIDGTTGKITPRATR